MLASRTRCARGGARIPAAFPWDSTGTRAVGDRTGRTSERRAARSCSVILIATPSPPRMLRARDRRGPVVILPGTRGVTGGHGGMQSRLPTPGGRIGSPRWVRPSRPETVIKTQRRSDVHENETKHANDRASLLLRSRNHNPALTSALSVTIPTSVLLCSSCVTGKNDTFAPFSAAMALPRGGGAGARAPSFAHRREQLRHAPAPARRLLGTQPPPQIAVREHADQLERRTTHFRSATKTHP